MPHATPLITTLVAALTAALLLGVVARKLHLPPLVGYLVAGVLIGPHTPGFSGDLALAAELSEIGIILLMFGVGLHFSPRELAEARGVAVPGALVQMAVATLLGWGVARGFGWTDGQGFVFGICLSVASTVVLLRALQERGEATTDTGKIAVGWLVVEDLAMVVALVLVPVGAALLDGRTPPGMLAGVGVAGPRDSYGVLVSLLVTLGKIAAFVVLMLIVGSRVMPAALSMVGALRSRELFSLAALVAALGVAYLAFVAFGVSFALGAFLSGLVLGALLGVGRFSGRDAVLAVLNTFLAVPSVVVGLVVYLLLSRTGPLGFLGWLFSFKAMVFAQSVLVLPVVTALTRQVVEDAQELHGEQLQSLGAGTLLRSLLLAWDERYALLTVVLAAFGRAISEVGAVMIVGGNIDGFTRVMTTAIALETSKGDLPLALGLGLVLLLVVLLLNVMVAAVRRWRTGEEGASGAIALPGVSA